MTLLHDISREPPSGEALMRVYKSKIIINAPAVKLLGLTDDSRVAFKVGEVLGQKRLYIGKKDYNAYCLNKMGSRYRIHSTSLCKHIADMLQGYGTYRIESENHISDYNGDVMYSVFFRKYEKEL